MINIQVLAPLIFGTCSLLLSLGLIITLPQVIRLARRLPREDSHLVALVILSSSIHLVRLHCRLHLLMHLALSHWIFLLPKGAALRLGHVLLLIGHHASLILPVLNEYLRALLLALEVHTLNFLGWAHAWLLLLTIIETVGLTLLDGWPLRAISWLVAAVVLVLFTGVLVEHLTGAVH